MPRLKSEVRLRRRLRGWRAGTFFVGRGAVDGVPHAGRDGPEEGQRHDQEQALQALGALDVAVFQAEAAGLEVREHGLDAPPAPVVEGAVRGRRGPFRLARARLRAAGRLATGRA